MYDTVYNAMVKLMDSNVEKGNSVMLVLEVLKNVICILDYINNYSKLYSFKKDW